MNDTTAPGSGATEPPLPSQFVRGICQDFFISALDGRRVYCERTAYHVRNRQPLCDWHALLADRKAAA